MRRGNAEIHALDELDRQLCQLLAADPRTSNRSLASATGVTDETVATRLVRMREAGTLALTVAVDWTAAGYHARGIARVRVRERTAVAVAEQFLDVPEVHAVVESSGAADLVVWLLATDVAALRQVATNKLRSASGVAAVTVDVVTETCWQDNSGTTLPLAPWSPADLPDPIVPLDELDRRVIEQLITDGHESNREIARRLNVSDGTVRGRVKRLEDAGLIRLTAVVDLITTGDLGSGASVFISTSDDDAELVARLRAFPNVGLVERCVGASDLYGFVVAPTADELDRFIGRDLRGLPGVQAIEVATAVETLRHRAHLQHLGDGVVRTLAAGAADQLSA